MPTRFLLRSVLVAAALALAGLGAGSVASAAASPGASSLRVMTFNIAYLKADPAAQDIVSLIRYYNPQVVFLNEVDGPNDADNQAHQIGRALNMQARAYLTEVHGGQRRGNAMLIAPGFRFLKVNKAPLGPAGCYPRGIIGATVDIGPKNVNLGVAHLDGKKAGQACAGAVTDQDAALAQARNLRRTVGNPGCTTIVGGDMNRQSFEPAYRELTTFLKDAWTQAAERDGKNFATFGWADGGAAATRIDYLFYKHATPLRADVPNDGEPVNGGKYDARYADGDFPSDHKPVVASFRVPAGRSCAVR